MSDKITNELRPNCVLLATFDTASQRKTLAASIRNFKYLLLLSLYNKIVVGSVVAPIDNIPSVYINLISAMNDGTVRKGEVRWVSDTAFETTSTITGVTELMLYGVMSI